MIFRFYKKKTRDIIEKGTNTEDYFEYTDDEIVMLLNADGERVSP